MIYDMTVFIGPYERRPVGMDRATLARMLGDWSIERAFAGRIDHLRMENGHAADPPAAPARIGGVTVDTIPVLDLTVSNWAEHAERYHKTTSHRLAMVRLHPGYHGYSLDDPKILGPLVEWTHHRGVVIQVVVSLDDARRQHPLGQVPDVPVQAVRKVAQAFPHQRFLVSGATFVALDGLGRERPANLWADTGRAEASGGIKRLVASGWGDRLTFASFAPLLIVHSALARVLADLDDSAAEKVLRQNALSLLDGN